MRKSIFIAGLLLILSSCTPKIAGTLEGAPDIWPDYAGVTVPANIAPLNFSYLGSEPAVLEIEGRFIRATRDGLFRIPGNVWSELCSSKESIKLCVSVKKDNKWLSFEPFSIFISKDEIDPWISYRLIPPGYQGWHDMGLYQRELGSYTQKEIIENSRTDEGCINCHTVCSRNPSRMLFHSRAACPGTFLVTENNPAELLDTKTDSTISALVYPFWHPSGKYVAFSVNKTLQAFYNNNPDRIEVYDEASDVVVYDVESHKVIWSPLTKSEDDFETFPAFSPDGKWLYFCSAAAVEDVFNNYSAPRYAIKRIAFDEGKFGDSLEMVYDTPAEGFSASFPRISPDGRMLVFTRHCYGNFSIWHKSADLWSVDLETGKAAPMEKFNSDDVESWHCWSGNSRWLIFSSRRDDGLFTKPYIGYVGPDGTLGKPFLLPQKDPKQFYDDLMFSFNLPEFLESPVPYDAKSIESAMHSATVNISY